MANTFKVGDIVVLKSGGPKMTVTEVTGSKGDTVHTTWFAGAKKERGVFPLETLEAAPVEAPKAK